MAGKGSRLKKSSVDCLTGVHVCR